MTEKRRVSLGLRLGENQESVIFSLQHHGSWPGGWCFQNRSTTIRILESLVRKGCVEKRVDRKGKASYHYIKRLLPGYFMDHK